MSKKIEIRIETMSKQPIFKPGQSTALQFGDELLNGNIHWRNTLLEVLRYTDDNLFDIANTLKCSVNALMVILNHNDSSFINFKQGARLLTLHDKVKPE